MCVYTEIDKDADTDRQIDRYNCDVPEVFGTAGSDAVLAQVQRPEARAPIQNGILAQGLIRSYTLNTMWPH